ncbi:helix-turn-helix transcriptional regulator [Acuticoccus sp. M5D2P5]|uniref:helix-turn-helix domain-containing protein n=1 Tax=Acuticoccus kalidii TaxID=2910977 RepID=UPI001F21B4B3|nr:helix-turn-helix transcriptional regulator [Acuticoccus kalidii]MCF3936421.1 helix-turn-helix transcriptional regulator [Acuticoccus kalidii]
MAPRKQPNPIDIHVGSRLKLRRTLMGMTQEKLGDQLGVTFQQVQKYEKGANRIGASRLQEISQILEVPVSFFFEDASHVTGEAAAPNRVAEFGFAEDHATPFEISRGSTSEAHALARAFSQIQDARIRRRIIDLVETLADSHSHRI